MIIALCKCGCGKSVNINENTRKNRVPDYIVGHNSKGRKCPWRVGKATKGSFKEGEDHPLWKENPSYQALHTWVRNHKPKPDNCERCNMETNILDASNISGEYKRDLNDYQYLCRGCHNVVDERVKNFKKRK